MKILITNDDGIRSEGIQVLAELALQFGEVTVAAPKNQCSAMSHRITIARPLLFEKTSFPVDGVQSAWQVEGTPADCVRVGMVGLMPVRADVVLAGVNKGYNCI